MSIRVLLSSRHKVVSEGIAAVLRTHPDMNLVGISENTERTQTLCDEVDPDVLLVGIHSQGAQELDLMHRLSHRDSPQSIVAYSSESDRNSIIEILDAGAKGYVSTTSSIDELMSAIRSAAISTTASAMSTPISARRSPARMRWGKCGP